MSTTVRRSAGAGKDMERRRTETRGKVDSCKPEGMSSTCLYRGLPYHAEKGVMVMLVMAALISENDLYSDQKTPLFTSFFPLRRMWTGDSMAMVGLI